MDYSKTICIIAEYTAQTRWDIDSILKRTGYTKEDIQTHSIMHNILILRMKDGKIIEKRGEKQDAKSIYLTPTKETIY